MTTHVKLFHIEHIYMAFKKDTKKGLGIPDLYSWTVLCYYICYCLTTRSAICGIVYCSCIIN